MPPILLNGSSFTFLITSSVGRRANSQILAIIPAWCLKSSFFIGLVLRASHRAKIKRPQQNKPNEFGASLGNKRVYHDVPDGYSLGDVRNQHTTNHVPKIRREYGQIFSVRAAEAFVNL